MSSKVPPPRQPPTTPTTPSDEGLYDFTASDTMVRRFYADSGGARMFDLQTYTPEISLYLQDEVRVLGLIFDQYSSHDHLVEIGCGTGTYRAWAAEQNLHYDGIDLVRSLIRQGQQQPRPPGPLRSKLHVGSAERLEQVFARQQLTDARRVITFFPFNCFGNLARARLVTASIARTGAKAFISTYKTDEETTRIRRVYYERCDYHEVRVESNQKGTVLRSKDGLRAYAYDGTFLLHLFAQAGLRLERTLPIGTIGIGYLFFPR